MSSFPLTFIFFRGVGSTTNQVVSFSILTFWCCWHFWQARNPVPMLVEKISHLLEMLHTTQVQSDMYLQVRNRDAHDMYEIRIAVGTWCLCGFLWNIRKTSKPHNSSECSYRWPKMGWIPHFRTCWSRHAAICQDLQRSNSMLQARQVIHGFVNGGILTQTTVRYTSPEGFWML